MQQLQ
jgi:hypothetical protein